MKNIISKKLFMFSFVCITVCVFLGIVKKRQDKDLINLQTGFERSSMQSYEFYDKSIQDRLSALVEEEQKSMDEINEKIRILRLKYELMELVEKKSNLIEDENTYKAYEKYFQMKQGELARIENIEDLSECGKVGFLNGHFGGVIFQIDRGMWLQYNSDIVNDIEEELLPRSLIITDPSMNLGFMNARAGMNFEKIQENAYAGEIQEGFMYWWEEKVYYIQYTDEYYEYVFLSNDQDGRDSRLIVSHK